MLKLMMYIVLNDYLWFLWYGWNVFGLFLVVGILVYYFCVKCKVSDNIFWGVVNWYIGNGLCLYE